MAQSEEKPVGLTKDVGYQIGVRRTLPIAPDDAWDLLISDEGINIWLGPVDGLVLKKGAEYELADGATGTVRVFEPGSHLRITWHPPGYERASLIQVRVNPAKGGRTVIAFHQEHLPDGDAREVRRDFFMSAMDDLALMVE
jgi:uncharacterized protein YndB with AHSA1/START domain